MRKESRINKQDIHYKRVYFPKGFRTMKDFKKRNDFIDAGNGKFLINPRGLCSILKRLDYYGFDSSLNHF